MNSWCFNSIWRNQSRVLLNMKKLFKMQQKWAIFHLNCMFQWLNQHICLPARSPWSALKTGLARLVSERSRRGGHSAFHRESHQTHTHPHTYLWVSLNKLNLSTWFSFYFFLLFSTPNSKSLLSFVIFCCESEKSWDVLMNKNTKYLDVC